MNSMIAPFLMVIVFALQPPAPGSGTQRQSPQDKTKTDEKQATVPPPAATNPVVRTEPPITAPPTPQPSGNTYNQLSSPPDKRGWDIPSVVNTVSTAFIALLTFGLLYVAHRQREVAHKQLWLM